MNLLELRLDCAKKQKMGLHFIMASVFIWCVVLGIQLSDLPILTKNLFTFCSTAPLVPLAFLLSKVLKIDFQNKDNPLTNLGILFSVNQILYLLIAMWVYPTVPEKMLMVIAMIFGAHLMPYSWLYNSKAYMGFSVAIPIAALLVGLTFAPYVLAMMMIFVEITFCICLAFENNRLVRQ
jgi:hypothetical protein